MVIWRGWGFLVLFFILFAMGFGWQWFPALWKAATGHEYAFSGVQNVGWGIGWVLVAVLLFLFTRFLLPRLETVPTTPEGWEARRAAKKAAEDRGETFRVTPAAKTTSSFFFIPLRWLVVVFLGIGVIMLAVNIPAAIDDVAEVERLEELRG